MQTEILIGVLDEYDTVGQIWPMKEEIKALGACGYIVLSATKIINDPQGRTLVLMGAKPDQLT